jgi:hypothetical protein
LDLQPHGASSGFRIFQCGLGIHSIGRINEHGDTSRSWHQFTQKPQALCSQLGIEKIDAGQVAAGPGKAGDKTDPDRVFGGKEDDGG